MRDPAERWLAKVVPWLSVDMAGRLVSAVVVILVVLIAVYLARRAIRANVEDPARRYRARKLVGVAGWLITLLFVAAAFSDRLASFAISVGVVGVAVAFALKEAIASLGARAAIAFGRIYEVGDRIQLGEVRGDVIDISVLRTTLMEVGGWVDGDLYTGRIVRVANNRVFSDPIFNYSADFSFLWDEIRVPVRYGSDIRLARALLVRATDEVCGRFVADATETWRRITGRYRLEPAQTDPLVTLVANDNWVEFTVRYVVPFTLRRVTKDQLFSAILAAVDASDRKVQLASATYELVAAPALEVKLTPPRGVE